MREARKKRFFKSVVASETNKQTNRLTFTNIHLESCCNKKKVSENYFHNFYYFFFFFTFTVFCHNTFM